MNKILILILSIISINVSSQTYADVNAIGSFYGKKLSEFEEKTKNNAISSDVKFGLESRLYKINDLNLLLDEQDDEKVISRINLIGSKGPNEEEIWYNIVTAANKDSNAEFIDSFIGEPNQKLYKYGIPLKEMVQILRSNKDTSSFMYYVIYKIKGLYYTFNMAEKNILINISNKINPGYEKK